jgi:hypothetical protein
MPIATSPRSTLPLPLLMAGILLGLAPLVSLGADKGQLLLNGKDFSGWRKATGSWAVAKLVSLQTGSPTNFVAVPGEGISVSCLSGRSGVDLISEAEFGDVQAHIEFCVSKHSNAGVYFMGRYEVQIYDSYGVDKDKYPGIECGGIYPRWINEQNVQGHSPRVNASKPAGEWQSFDVVFRAPRFDAAGKKIANARFVKVVHNGKLIHQNVELTCPTRSPLPEEEKATGPLRLQGDHGPVAYRNVRVKPMQLK